MPIILISLLASISLGASALVEMIPGSGPEQYTQDCQTSNPRLERLAATIQRGEIDYGRAALDEGVDVNETWRDLPPQVCRSLLLRIISYSQDEMLDLLLKRGADPRSVPREALGIPVRNGRVDMVRRLLAVGLKPHDNNEIVRAGLKSENVAMLDLLASSGVSIDPSSVPSWALTDDLTVHLVPKYLRPNDRTFVGNEACALQEIFDWLSPDQDGVSPLALFSKKRKHYLTVGYKDAQGANQAAVFELGKDIVRTTLKVIETRSGKAIEYQDEEARKSGLGGKG